MNIDEMQAGREKIESSFELSRMLGITVNELCKITGYSRQGLYQIFHNQNGIRQRRWDVAMLNIEKYIEKQYEIDLKMAWDQKNNRLALIQELMNIGTTS